MTTWSGEEPVAPPQRQTEERSRSAEPELKCHHAVRGTLARLPPGLGIWSTTNGTIGLIAVRSPLLPRGAVRDTSVRLHIVGVEIEQGDAIDPIANRDGPDCSTPTRVEADVPLVVGDEHLPRRAAEAAVGDRPSSPARVRPVGSLRDRGRVVDRVRPVARRTRGRRCERQPAFVWRGPTTPGLHHCRQRSPSRRPAGVHPYAGRRNRCPRTS